MYINYRVSHSTRPTTSRQPDGALAARLEQHFRRLVLRAEDEVEARKRVVRELLVGDDVVVVVQARDVRALGLALVPVVCRARSIPSSI